MNTTALVIAPLIGIVSVLLFHFVPLKGFTMAVVVFVVSFLLAVADILLTGGQNSITGPNVAADFTALYAVQQVVFRSLQDNMPAAPPKAVAGNP